MKVELEKGMGLGRFLLGDKGYAISHHMLTPFRKNQTKTRRRQRYNKSHKATRWGVERTIGVWKKRFPILNKMNCELGLAMQIITSCAVLHNIARRNSKKFHPIKEEEVLCYMEKMKGFQETTNGAPEALRDALVDNYFNNSNFNK